MHLERLEERQTPASLVVGAAVGDLPVVRVLDQDGTELQSILAFSRTFRGGVNVAWGDVTGDGVADVIAAQGRGGSQVKVFDGVTFAQIGAFQPFGTTFRGGVNLAYVHQGTTASGDVVAGMASGGSTVRVFDGETFSLLQSWQAYGRGVNGVRVAVGNLDGGYGSDVITAPGPGGDPVLKAFDLDSGGTLQTIRAYDRSYRGGVQIASGDFDDNRVPDIVALDDRARKPEVKVFASGPGDTLVGRFAVPTRGVSQLGVVQTPGPGPDRIGLSSAGARGNSSPVIGEFDSQGNAGGTIAVAGARRSGLSLSSAPEATFVGYSGPRWDGIVYNPTWPNWTSTVQPQLSDSDFANDAFKALWSSSVPDGRHDLATFHDTGFNLIRLFNWGPTRGWDAATQTGSGHINFLSEAQQQGQKVIVPVSNWFLGDNVDSWNHQNPDANYSFTSAPVAIQNDLLYFIRSITKDGQIHPAVHSISVGNEMDVKIDDDPGNTAKLKRSLWWIVNLHDQLVKQFGTNVPKNFLTIPVANGDQGAASISKKSWFQVILHGTQAGQLTPNGAVPGGTFTDSVRGLENYSWYKDWFYNSTNVYQFGPGLANTIKQYDTGIATGSTWSDQWPGEKFEVPLLFSELGINRLANGVAGQFDIVANKQVQVVVDAMKTTHNFMGMAVFEFNDEPNKNNYKEPPPTTETTFGIQKYSTSDNPYDFRNGVILSNPHTGPTTVMWTTFPDIQYPLYKLNPVKVNGVSLLDKIRSILRGS